MDATMNGHASAGGQPTSMTSGTARNEASRLISAVSSALSVLDFTSAFQLACKSAPNSTAMTTGQVSSTVSALLSQLPGCRAPLQVQGNE